MFPKNISSVLSEEWIENEESSTGKNSKAKSLKWNQKCAILLKNWFKVLSTIFNIYGLWRNGVYYLWMQEYFSIRKSNIKLHMKRLKIKAVHVNRGIIKVLRTFNTWLKSFHKLKTEGNVLKLTKNICQKLTELSKKKKRIELSKAIYRFNSVAIKIPMPFL